VKTLRGTFALLAVSLASLTATQAQDPLPSWNEGKTKESIIAFVANVTKEGSSDFVPPAERIATFDNDGTLWCEQPVVELVFTEGKVKEMAAKDPSLKEKQPFKAALEHDRAYFETGGMKTVLELVVATHANTSQKDFEEEVGEFFKTAKHPKFGVPFSKTAYLPMVELLNYLRANGFQTWICSGGWMDVMRGVAQEAYGIPPQQVIGSSMKEQWMEKSGQYVLWLQPELLTICDHAGKPVNIDLHIGKGPVLAAGNVRTGGDIEMLRYCQQRKGMPTFQLMVNHDDAVREFAYGEKNHESLDAAKKNGWTVVSMKDDWKRVFAFER
jgi:haloacid dehalogenase-like hydrolase